MSAPSPQGQARGPIGQDELRARMERQEEVAGHIIQGDDLMAIIREATDGREL